MTFRNIYFILFSGLILTSCGGGSSAEDIPPAAPTKATLVFPEQNSECNEGTIISDTKSSVTFNWSDATNTTNYEIFVKNLDTDVTSTYTSSDSEKIITINRGTPYSWYVVSKNSGTQIAQSDTWKFYNAGQPVSSHAPFPADLVSPAMGANLSNSTTSVNLKWTGSDVDNDISKYTIQLNTTSPPTSSIGTVTTTSLDTNVSSNTTYYWRVITEDSKGNTSTSEIFQFKVN
ncbi:MULTISPECIES: hypothetical protein [unclassified Tenacibaculum]|uniref:hypothetical protein n=1 Tax=unclassified Tenacibaculum TaxID=2635139 RepID=UPI001F3859A0|nr:MULTISPECIES: hypothetical protein [unclassified Tenacibaculum]MCF2875125.1 hypothetical protein [Tenacibaculum sp. Cn5-1]MCF2935201.1 hypothetical protein [Tenacibaculum sp. Cn5-34]MCG7511357.1 hypothetical protein [Tenacibaculum sp. Cn5-46]